MIEKKIKKIRELMIENRVDAYYISSSDYHESEYIGEHFKVREYITGFSGSYGNLVITKDKIALWTDFRYENIVRQLLKGNSVEIHIVGSGKEIEIKEWICNELKKGEILGFDGRTVSAKQGLDLKTELGKKEIEICEKLNIVDKFWDGRPNLSQEKVWYLNESYSGESENSKIAKIKMELEKEGTNYNIITTLDDIAWILNLRGKDVKNTPVFLSNLIIGKERDILYIDLNKLEECEKERVKSLGVELKEYNLFYSDVEKFKEDESILVDTNKINYLLYNIIKDKKIKDKINPSTMLKSIKNDTEIKNIKETHIKDGVAVTKFLYWLKSNVGKIQLDEIIAQEKIDSLRGEQKGFLEPSFGSISAYGKNAAMPHYSASRENFSKIEKKALYLIDSGGQYLGGTTDITRTIALGEVEEEIKRDYTLVLKGMINLTKVKFLHGTTGSNLDICARVPMWNYGINYAHGTGHGIGYMLGVHEGPHSIRGSYNQYPLVPGMIVTNEPGIYIFGSHGIRIENEILVIPFKETSHGKFYQFETLTYAPIDLEPVIVEMLTKEEKDFINWYHGEVCDKLSKHLSEEEKIWLKDSTKNI